MLIKEEIGERDTEYSNANLIALVPETQNQTNTDGELDQVRQLVRDFALELLRRRLSMQVQFLQLIERQPDHVPK